MELEGESLNVAAATESDITRAFDDDKGRGDFLVLAEADQTYIQVSGTGEGPYTLEYREGDAAHHYQCERAVNKAEARSAFILYLAHDASWKAAFEWKKMDCRPWWKFW